MTVETKVITATTKAADAIGKSTTGLAKIVAELGSLVQDHGDLMDQIAEAQQELNGIHSKTETTIREAAADIKLRIKEDKIEVLNDLLEEFDLAHISTDTLNDMAEKIVALGADNDANLNKAVAIATNQTKAVGEKALAEAESNHKVDVAEKDAEIKAQSREIEFLSKQVASLEETISDERQARIQIAASESQKQGVTVQTNGK